MHNPLTGIIDSLELIKFRLQTVGELEAVGQSISVLDTSILQLEALRDASLEAKRNTLL